MRPFVLDSIRVKFRLKDFEVKEIFMNPKNGV